MLFPASSFVAGQLKNSTQPLSEFLQSKDYAVTMKVRLHSTRVFFVMPYPSVFTNDCMLLARLIVVITKFKVIHA